MARQKSKSKRGRGRPPYAADAARFAEITSEIVAALAGGNYLEAAAAYAGVSKQWIYDALRHGARDQAAGTRTPYADFLDAVKKAEADAEIAGLKVISSAGEDRTITIGKGKTAETRVIPGSWQALAWRLERRHPDRWGRRSPGPAPAAPPPPPLQTAAPETVRDKLLRELAGIRERRKAGAA